MRAPCGPHPAALQGFADAICGWPAVERLLADAGLAHAGLPTREIALRWEDSRLCLGMAPLQAFNVVREWVGAGIFLSNVAESLNDESVTPAMLAAARCENRESIGGSLAGRRIKDVEQGAGLARAGRAA